MSTVNYIKSFLKQSYNIQGPLVVNIEDVQKQFIHHCNIIDEKVVLDVADRIKEYNIKCILQTGMTEYLIKLN